MYKKIGIGSHGSQPFSEHVKALPNVSKIRRRYSVFSVHKHVSFKGYKKSSNWLELQISSSHSNKTWCGGFALQATQELATFHTPFRSLHAIMQATLSFAAQAKLVRSHSALRTSSWIQIASRLNCRGELPKRVPALTMKSNRDPNRT